MAEFTNFKITRTSSSPSGQIIEVEAIEIDDDLILEYVREYIDADMVFTASQLRLGLDRLTSIKE